MRREVRLTAETAEVSAYLRGSVARVAMLGTLCGIVAWTPWLHAQQRDAGARAFQASDLRVLEAVKRITLADLKSVSAPQD